jgi:hypothetical protein
LDKNGLVTVAFMFDKDIYIRIDCLAVLIIGPHFGFGDDVRKAFFKFIGYVIGGING